MSKQRSINTVITALVVVALIAVGVLFLTPGDGDGDGDGDGGDANLTRVSLDDTSPRAEFVGRNACVTCHQQQHDAWVGSHHDLAMQEPTDETVLGDFNDAEFEHFGVTSKFFKKDGSFIVHTQGADGAMTDFPVKYVFGFTPLQQYLIEFPGGRLQSLTIAWDSRPKEQGGQRWYHLYPESKIEPGNWLHWTQRGQNWNTMCSDCHSTDLRLNYDHASDTFDTTWNEIDVSCEACHGPGSAHVKWAESYKLSGTDAAEKAKLSAEEMGLTVKLKPGDRAWVNDPEKGLHLVSDKPLDDLQVETCARCHARRGHVSAHYRHGDPLEDHFMPALLEENLYFPDGQIQDEVYVYGSFIQSKMHHKGVRCTDCHDAHTTKLIAPGNALCVRCHLPQKYDTPDHHHHEPGTAGAACVECHMPTRTYMGVDPRRDHSLRIPRPDLSVELGTPNACNQCHTKPQETAKWAADKVRQWYGDTRPDDPHYARILAAARRNIPEAESFLVRTLIDENRPTIVRATAASHLRQYLSQDSVQAAMRALNDPDPLVRSTASLMFLSVGHEQRLEIVGPLLGDPVRGVRHRAARVLMDVPREMFTPQMLKAFDAAIAGYEKTLLAHSGNRDAQMELGGFYADRQNYPKAIKAFRRAIEWDDRHIDARMALATLYSSIGRNQDAEPLIRSVLEQKRGYGTSQEVWDRAQAHAHFSLGLLLVEQQKFEEAVGQLEEATRLTPDRARYFYNLGLLYNQLRRPDACEAALLRARQLEPNNGEYLFALATTMRDAGLYDRALSYAEQLARMHPRDPGPVQLMQDIRQRMLQSPPR